MTEEFLQNSKDQGNKSTDHVPLMFRQTLGYFQQSANNLLCWSFNPVTAFNRQLDSEVMNLALALSACRRAMIQRTDSDISLHARDFYFKTNRSAENDFIS